MKKNHMDQLLKPASGGSMTLKMAHETEFKISIKT